MTWLLVALPACGGGAAPYFTSPPTAGSATDPAAALSRSPGASPAIGPTAPGRAEASQPVGSARSVAAPAPTDRFAGASFPPPAFEPLEPRTAKPGDGRWQPVALPLGAAGIVQRTTAHPHHLKGWVFATVVAFDRRAVDLALVAGTAEPASKTVGPEQRTGLVPAVAQPQLLAVFNGGFKARHGAYGMMADGQQLVPPRADACAVVLYRDGGVRLGSWSRLATDQSQMVAWRQTPPCLLENGVFEPRLEQAYSSRRWGSAVGGVHEIRRSAVGLDATGRSLLYGFGDWVTPLELARVMKAAGAVDAAQLDINWKYTRFFFFRHPPGAAPEIAETIIPKLEFSRSRYVAKPSYRDFFYVTVRQHAGW